LNVPSYYISDGSKEANDGYSYILTCIDCFSQYVFAIPLVSKEANKVVQAFNQIFQQVMPPNILHLDNSGEVVANVIKELEEKYKMKLINGGAYHPQSQEHVERFNKTLKRQLGKHLTTSNLRRWLKILSSIVRSYNITVHDVTNFSTIKAKGPKLSYLDVPTIIIGIEHNNRCKLELVNGDKLSHINRKTNHFILFKSSNSPILRQQVTNEVMQKLP
jgi:hypothetical protein